MVECLRPEDNKILLSITKMKKIAVLITVLIGLLTLGVVSAQAQYGPPPYGEVPPEGQILVDKKIKDPSKKGDVYVDNLGAADYHFSPGEEVFFKIKVKNTGNTTFSQAEVKDLLPQYVDYVLGSGGVRKDIRDVTTTYQDLTPDEEKEFEVRGKVVNSNEIPNDQGLYCVLNKAEVLADGQTDSDTAQLCIEKKVLGAVAQPPAGAELLALGLTFASISALGLFLKKKEAITARTHFKTNHSVSC